MSFKGWGNRDREALCPNSWEPMEIIVFELAKALKVPRSLAILPPADGPPDPEILLAHGDGVAALGHHVAEERGHGRLAVNGEASRHRHVFFRFQRRVPRTLSSFMPR